MRIAGTSGVSWSYSVSQEAIGANRGLGGVKYVASSDRLSSLSTDSPRSMDTAVAADKETAFGWSTVSAFSSSPSNLMQPVETRRNFSAWGLITKRESTSGGS